MTSLPYFGYGSNLDLDDLKRWCSQHAQPFPVVGTSGIRAVLPDYTLIFNMYYSGRNGGVLNIEKCPGQAAPGVLFETMPEGLSSLDKKENVPVHYNRKIVTVFTESGEAVKAVTYKIVPEMTENHFVKPSDEYAGIVLKGSKAFGLDTRMLNATKEGKTPPWMIDRVFTYGTLMKGECRDQVLNFRGNIVSVQNAEIPGVLFNLGDFPGMQLSTDTTSTVKGELYHIRNVGKSVEILDKIEGFRGYENKGSLYTRVALKVMDDSGDYIWAWIYRINQVPPVNTVIESGDWRKR